VTSESGNWMLCEYWDWALPTVTDNYSFDNVWENGASKTITLSPSDTWWSWISTTKWCQWVWCIPTIVWTVITKTANYNNTIRYQTWDNAWNASSIWSFIVKLDNTLPTVTDNYAFDNVWDNVASKTITLSPSDTWWSWLSTTKWCQWVWCIPTTVWTVITKTANYNNTIRYQSWDNAWNTSLIWTITVKLDITAPTVTDNYSFDNVWENGASKTITLSPSDTWWSWISTTKWCQWVWCIPTIVWTVITKTANYNNTIRYQTWDNAWNTSSIWSFILKLDNTAPTTSDITTTINATNYTTATILNAYFTASNNKNIDINVNVAWWSPITLINWSFEDFNNSAWFIAPAFTSVTSPLTKNLNISLVDNNLGTNNYRDYTYNITKVCDQAGNCTNNIAVFTYHVYAGSINSLNSNVTWLWNFDDEVADWISNKLTATLNDTYYNKIIPVYKSDWITLLRSVTLRANYNNSLRLDQFNNSWIWVESTWFDNISYVDTIFWINQNKQTTITAKANNDWIYDINFKVYAPNYKAWATDWRQFAVWNFNINNIYWNISDLPGDIPLWSAIDFQFKPIYSSILWWDLYNNWFAEWKTQTWSIDVNKITTSATTTSEWFYFVQTWSTSNYFTWTWRINNWIKKIITKTPTLTQFIYNPFDTWLNYLFSTVFTLTDWTRYVDDIKDLRLNGYITYSLWSKVVTYLAWILNEINSQSFKHLKIYWITNIEKSKQKDLSINQDTNDIQNLDWEIIKSGLKWEIRKNAISSIKFSDITNWSNSITDLSWPSWQNVGNGWNKLWNLLYFGALDWANITLDNWNYNNSSTAKFSWRKTIIIVWWNLYIKSNIINNNYNSDILWIIVLQDENWKWWKVYIDNVVQEIDAVIYTDKSIIGYDTAYDNGNIDPIIKHEIDWNIDNSWIQNQLYIYWTLFTENTIWWSRISPAVCPFYVQSDATLTCDSVEAQKYDLNYLRAWFNNKYNAIYSDYSVVVKYNSILQSTPPPLFSK
jgi:hypothetical protein